MVSVVGELLDALRDVRDPELPDVDVVELGIVRGLEIDPDGRVTVEVTPTYSGCPATKVIADDVVSRLERGGHARVSVRTVLSPAWTTDWMSETARRKLAAVGIAPPPVRACGLGPLPDSALCPRCGAETRELVSGFGSTPCKALWRCSACREPFELFKSS